MRSNTGSEVATTQRSRLCTEGARCKRFQRGSVYCLPRPYVCVVGERLPTSVCIPRPCAYDVRVPTYVRVQTTSVWVCWSCVQLGSVAGSSWLSLHKNWFMTQAA